MSDARLLLTIESRKKSAGVAAILNLIIPGAGYMYCGRWILGVIALVVTTTIAILTVGIGWFFMALILVVDGVLCANRYNKNLITEVLAEQAD